MESYTGNYPKTLRCSFSSIWGKELVVNYSFYIATFVFWLQPLDSCCALSFITPSCLYNYCASINVPAVHGKVIVLVHVFLASLWMIQYSITTNVCKYTQVSVLSQRSQTWEHHVGLLWARGPDWLRSEQGVSVWWRHYTYLLWYHRVHVSLILHDTIIVASNNWSLWCH